MRKRLYLLLPNLQSTQQIVDELLLARIDAQHIHVMAKDGIDLGDLPEASILQKSDLIHGIETGMVLGGILGLIGGVIAITALQLGSMMGLIILGCTLFGAGFGIWTSGMIGASTKNTRLKDFEESIEHGNILIMADIPMNKVKDIMHKVETQKNIILGGEEPSIPAFP